jgi:acyl carrier protein
MITYNKIEEEVRKIIVTQLDISEEEVVPEASFTDDLNADSLDLVELVMAMEEKFDIEIPDDEAEKISTVQSAITTIANHLEKIGR